MANPACHCVNTFTFHIRERDEQVSLHLHSQTCRQAIVVLNAYHLQESVRVMKYKKSISLIFWNQGQENKEIFEL